VRRDHGRPGRLGDQVQRSRVEQRRQALIEQGDEPGGRESVKVTLTAKGGKVTTVQVEGSGGTPNSQQYQSAFISGISGEVVGKPLATLKVGAVSGSSLTGNGFNAAVEKIRADAA
jgi:uncharacterized protein with FMN-binding domain